MTLNSLYHRAWAFFGSVYYGFPSTRLYVAGVTGTKGKSTTVELMGAVFEASGAKTAVLSSVARKIGGQWERNTTGNSMPGRAAIQRFLRDALRAGCTHAFIEVTSQGVLQHRHEFIEWDAAAFMNLAPEHIEAHGSFEAYRAAKVSFFEYAARARKPKKLFLVNEVDPAKNYFIEAAKHHFGNAVIEFSGERFLREGLGSHFDLRSERTQKKLGEWLFADFNLENAAAASALAEANGISWDAIGSALSSFKGVPGRLEVVQRKPFAVIVDYAHTPDSLKKVYVAAKRGYMENPAEGTLIAVLGSAGGGRDKWKRAEMGRIAGAHANEIVLTDEDPYDEDPRAIIGEIREGILQEGFPQTRLYEELDRRAAIRKAISLAKKGDVVVMTGKGSELWIHGAHGAKTPWNERNEAAAALAERE